MDAADLTPRTYREMGSGHPADLPVRTIEPPRATAQALYDAFSRLREAETALGAAEERVPAYTGQWSGIDYYGPQEEARNRAIDAFEDALIASVRARTSHISDGR